jgi:nucleotide-binding universal stress UspA family protein
MQESPFVLVAYDGSPDADVGLEWAIDTARLTGARMKVVVAADPPSRLPMAFREQARRWTHAVTSSARSTTGDAGVSAEVLLEYGDALPVLLRACEGASLVVVGSRGHSLWDAPWIGSVSQHLAGRAASPVVVVRRMHNPAARRIVVGVDGSPSSVRALGAAAQRASLTTEEVLAVHAYQHLSLAAGGRIGVQAIDLSTEVEDAAERLAAELVAGIAIDYPDVKLRSVAVIGRPARVLAHLADDASLVVIGSRGRTPLQELVLGSVSAEVLHKAECPVMVVR